MAASPLTLTRKTRAFARAQNARWKSSPSCRATTVKECTKKKESRAKKKRLEELTAAERVVKKQKRLSDVCNRYAGSEVDNQLGKAIFSAGLPFEMVENREFKKYGKLRQRAGENYKEPCAENLVRRSGEVY